MSEITGQMSRAFSEYVLIPRRTRKESKITDVSLKSRITHNIEIPLPFLSAAMSSVTGPELAIALALHGGLGTLPCHNVSIETQIENLRKVKRYKSGFVHDVITIRPDDRIKKLVELEKQFGYSTFPVAVEEKEGKRLVGLITGKKYHPEKDLGKMVKERMMPLEGLIVGKEGISLDEANDLMTESGIGVLPIIDKKGYMKSVVFWKDFKRHLKYPNAFINPADKTLRVAGAVSTHLDEDMERAKKLAKNGADFLLIDSSDLFSDFGKEAMNAYKKLKVPIIAGNIVDRDGFNFLAELGADCIKVGHGSGSICTTRKVKSTGRGQATAVIECARARDEYFKRTGKYIPICSDGGIDTTGNMAVAFALGADLLMMGKFFAGFTESANPLISKKFKVIPEGPTSSIREVTVYVKEYWGEASERAKSFRRYGHEDPRTFIIEGDEGYVLHKGSIHKQLPKDFLAIRGALSSCGCRNLKEFYQRAKLELQSPESYREGGLNILK
jgi:IMP dehydrogenase